MNDHSLTIFNAADLALAVRHLRACCGSSRWCQAMASCRPIPDVATLHQVADQSFAGMLREDWLEAFASHPEIGDVDSLRMKFVGNNQWSRGEQAGVAEADELTLREFAEGNDEYRKRFGYIFIVCASGKSAGEMLDLLRKRISNDADMELPVAAAEQRRITHLRLDKLDLSN